VTKITKTPIVSWPREVPCLSRSIIGQPPRTDANTLAGWIDSRAFGVSRRRSIAVWVESDAVVLNFRADSLCSGEWKSIQQRVPIRLTACHLSGQRPWFVCPVYCNGRYCGRRAAILYGAGELFACRRCYGLSYASQQQTALTSRPGAGSEDQDEARRQCRPAGAIPGKAKGNAPAHISASAGPRGSGNVLLYSAR
jgi:hypothetical protein